MTERKHKGKLFVLAGPSGVGKGTLRGLALSGIDGLVYSISCTTRAPRKGEREGVDYRFVSQEKFQEMVEEGLFLEYAPVHKNNRYGTLRKDVVSQLDAGNDVMLEIDVQGAFQVRERCPESILIFIAPPSYSLNVLEERLRERKSENTEEIQSRLESAQKEMQQASSFDHILFNDDVNRASQELRDLVLSYRKNG